MVELQQEMGIQVIFRIFGSSKVSVCIAQVSNQPQHRQQPRNGVQQLLQAQQASLSEKTDGRSNRVFLQL